MTSFSSAPRGTLLEEQVLHPDHARRTRLGGASSPAAISMTGAASTPISQPAPRWYRSPMAAANGGTGALSQVTERPRQVRRRVGDHHQLVGTPNTSGTVSPASAKSPSSALASAARLAGLHARHHHRHFVARSRGADGEHDLVAEQRAHRLHAIDDLSDLQPRLGVPPCPERGVLGRLLLGRGPWPGRASRRGWGRRRRRRPLPEDTTAGRSWCAARPETWRQLTFDLHERGEQLPGTASASGLQEMASATELASAGIGGGLLAGTEQHLRARAGSRPPIPRRPRRPSRPCRPTPRRQFPSPRRSNHASGRAGGRGAASRPGR